LSAPCLCQYLRIDFNEAHGSCRSGNACVQLAMRQIVVPDTLIERALLPDLNLSGVVCADGAYDSFINHADPL
jgi:hypothetical protein